MTARSWGWSLGVSSTDSAGYRLGNHCASEHLLGRAVSDAGAGRQRLPQRVGPAAQAHRGEPRARGCRRCARLRDGSAAGLLIGRYKLLDRLMDWTIQIFRCFPGHRADSARDHVLRYRRPAGDHPDLAGGVLATADQHDLRGQECRAHAARRRAGGEGAG